MNADKTVQYFKDKEWSMGNGQCPDCHGVSESWHGHPLYKTSKEIGHKKGCKMAEMLTEMGQKPLMIGDYKSELEYESYIADSGQLGTRPKTKNGCSRYKKLNGYFNEKITNTILDKIFGRTHNIAKKQITNS